MSLQEVFAQALAAITPVRTDKVVIPMGDFIRVLGTDSADYQPAPEAHEFTMMSCGVMPSVRAALGEARAYYEDPQRTILVRPHAAQIAEESGEKPWRLKSSAAIMVHTHKITRWTQGMNIVVRGAIQSVEKPNTFLAMHCRFDAQDNVTVKRIYVPVCDEFSRVKGMARLPVTAENVAFAFRVMALAREDMKHKAGSYVLAPALLQRARQDLTGPS